MPEAQLHRFHSGRYHLKYGPMEVIFTSVEKTGIKGDFTLLNYDGEITGSIERSDVDWEVEQALEEVYVGEHLDFDEYVPSKIYSRF